MRATIALRQQVAAALQACEDKKAANIAVLEMDKNAGAFTDYFLLCTGYSTPQVEAIIDAIEEALKARGLRPQHREGRSGAEWLLLDYGGFIVHVLTERLRLFYDLERLWRMARRIDFDENAPGSSAAGSVARGGSP